MHFNALNAFPGLYEVRIGRLQKKIIFWQPKMGGYTPGGYTQGITVIDTCETRMSYW